MKYFLLLILFVSSQLLFAQTLKGPESETKTILENIKQFSSFVISQQPKKLRMPIPKMLKFSRWVLIL